MYGKMSIEEVIKPGLEKRKNQILDIYVKKPNRNKKKTYKQVNGLII